MAKKSLRRLRSEKEQFGCMGGLISMFDFRQGGSTQRLLQDRRHGSKHFGGVGNEENKQGTSTSSSQTCQGTLGDGEKRTVTDALKPSVKKLLEEEMSSKNDAKIENAGESKQCNSGYGEKKKKSQRKAKKSRKNSCDEIRDVGNAENVGSEGSCHHKPEHQATNSVDINSVMEELCRQIHQKSVGCGKHEQLGELEMELDRKSPGFEEKLSEAVKFLVSQKLSDGSVQVENGEIQTSKDLLNALQILSSDEELFLKLLRDPNSLLDRDVQDLPDAKAKKGESKADVSVDKLINPRHRKYHNFFRKKVRSRLRNGLNGSKFSQNSEKIVILKPGPVVLQNPESESSPGPSNKELSRKVGSHYFFSEMKRKLKHAMGVEQHKTAKSDVFGRSFVEHQNARRSIGAKDYAGMNSPTKDHFFIERIARPSTGRLKESEKNTEAMKVSSLYIEAKKHLSEILSNEDQNADCSSRQVQKPLGRILSLPDSSTSPAGSPPRMRVAASDRSEAVNENKELSPVSHLCQTTENSQEPCISNEIIDIEVKDHDLILSVAEKSGDDKRVEEASCSIDAVDIGEVAETIAEEESTRLDVSPEISCSSVTRDDKNVEITEVFDEEQDTQCSNQTPEEDESPSASSPLASPPHSSVAKKDEYPEKIFEIQERSSPVSVLDPLPEDVVSPSSTRSHSDETSMQPLRIHFEDCSSPAANQGDRTKPSMDNKELVYEYIKAVLQASSLNWDELYIKSLTSDTLLDSSLLVEVEFYPNQLCHDRKLLFDCVNEVLMEMYGHYFGSSPWMRNTIQEVFNAVHWHLLPLPLPRTLDQIVSKDMAKSGTWLDLRGDIESIGVEMGEAIVDDLIQDIITSCTTADPECSTEM